MNCAGQSSIEAKIEADSNDITEYLRDDRSEVGMFGLGSLCSPSMHVVSLFVISAE